MFTLCPHNIIYAYLYTISPLISDPPALPLRPSKMRIMRSAGQPDFHGIWEHGYAHDLE
jgi:hypothetical protein